MWIRQLIVGAVLLGVFMFTLALFIPRLAAPVFRGRNLNKPPYQIQAIGSPLPGFYGALLPPVSLNVDMPSVMRISETKTVFAEVVPSLRDWPLSDKLTAKLRAPDFKIEQTESDPTAKDTGRFYWSWLISCQSLGQRQLFFDLEPPYRLELTGDVQNVELDLNKHSLLISITVVDEIGLTASQEALLRYIGIIISIVATVIALPFINRLFESKPKDALPRRKIFRLRRSRRTRLH